LADLDPVAVAARLAALDKVVAQQNKLDQQLANLAEILTNQRRLGKRFLWLLVLPFLVMVVVVIWFYVLSARLFDVDDLTQELTIEKTLNQDQNIRMAIDQYEKLAETRKSASLLARLGILYFQLDSEKYKNEAIQKLEMAQRLEPGAWLTYRYLTYVYTNTGDEKKALVAGEYELKQLNKYDAATYNNLAWVYATSNDETIRNLELAEKDANEAKMLTRGKSTEILDTIAKIESIKGGAR